MEALSVDTFCSLIVRSRLLSAAEVLALSGAWLREAGDQPVGTQDLANWLTARGHLTDYQANTLLRGHADRLFINEYKLLERIGVGGMAGVYMASHRLGQVVAIKVLPPSKAKDPGTFARFRREARLAVRLRHPNVVHTFHVGEMNGLHYLVMEYLDGETLEDVLARRKRLPSAEAARLIHQGLRGLECLHHEGVIHRDLKPANLMLIHTRRDDTTQATVKILDVGLGRALFDEGTPNGDQPMELTAAGDLLGSPDYMAPEQARDAHLADVRADIYSLGCVLYRALTGQVLFPTSNVVQKMLRHAQEPPRPVRELNAEVPAGLQPVLDRMLAKDPAQRFPTPERAAEALQPFLVAAEEPAAWRADPQRAAYEQWLAANRDPEEDVAAAAPPSAAPSAAEAEGRLSRGLPFSRRDVITLAVAAVGMVGVAFLVRLIVRMLVRPS